MTNDDLVFMSRAVQRGLGLTVAGLMLAGCLSLPVREAERQHLYQLSLVDGAEVARQAPRPSAPVLLVGLPIAQAGYDTARMVYLQRPHEMAYFATSQWADAPPQMLRPLLVQAMERSGAWRAVIQTHNSIRADYRLDTERLMLQQEFFQTPSRVRLSLRMQLVELREHRVVSTREFEAVEATSSDDPYGGVIAANRAVATVLGQASEWLAGCVKATPQQGC